MEILALTNIADAELRFLKHESRVNALPRAVCWPRVPAPKSYSAMPPCVARDARKMRKIFGDSTRYLRQIRSGLPAQTPGPFQTELLHPQRRANARSGQKINRPSDAERDPGFAPKLGDLTGDQFLSRATDAQKQDIPGPTNAIARYGEP